MSKINSLTSLILLTALGLTLSCGGYDAADPDDLEPRVGEIVGVLVDEGGGAHPDSWIQLFKVGETTTSQAYQGIDSDGRFGVFPPDTGVYNIVGSFGDPETSTNKAIIQNVAFSAGGAMNIGQIKGQKVALVTANVETPEGVEPEGVKMEVLGVDATTTTLKEGVGIIAIGIPAGTYQVRFSKEGLTTKIMEDVVLPAGEAILLDNVVMTKSE